MDAMTACRRLCPSRTLAAPSVLRAISHSFAEFLDATTADALLAWLDARPWRRSGWRIRRLLRRAFERFESPEV